MRVLFVSNLYPPHFRGGYELVLKRTRDEWTRRGLVSWVAASRYGLEDRAEPDEDDVFRVLTYRDYDHSPPLLPLRAQWRAQRREAAMLTDIISACRPDIISVWNLGNLSSAILCTLMRTRVPVSFRFGDWWPAVVRDRDPWLRAWASAAGRLTRRLPKAVLRRYLERNGHLPPPEGFVFDHYIVNSRALATLLAERGVTLGPHGTLIPSGVDIGRFSAPTRRFAEDGVLRVLVVGRICAAKGQDDAVRAIAALRRAGVKASLTLAGPVDDEKYAETVRRLTEDAQVTEQVKLLGAVQPEDIPALYAAHDVLLYPAVWEEPFGNSIVEAWAAGVLVVGTATGGTAELLMDGETGYIYPPGDVDACVRVLTEIAEGARERERPREVGRRRAEQEFALAATVDRMEEFFADVIASASM